MNRNVESHFALNPTNLDISRSKFDRSHSVKTSFNVGDIIPFYVEEVLPGDTFNVKTNKVIRMQTLQTPIMDNLYIDSYYFYVPLRLVWAHFREFMGENTAGHWIPAVTYQIPQINAPSGGWNVGTIADYMGIPTGIDNFSVSALPFRAYALIMSEWFRDENIMDPLNVPLDETTITGVNTGTFVSDVVKGGLPYKAAKYHDYFTSALPAPQKGPDVPLPLDNLPVISGVSHASQLTDSSGRGPHYTDSNGNPLSSTWNLVANNSFLGRQSTSTTGGTATFIDNLWATTNGAVNVTINSLRLAFQIQKLYERDARGGTRYIEIIKSHFGVTSPDSRLQRPEYLGGNRCPINITQITQNSESATTPQGTVTGMSQTVDRNIDFTKSFTEHGYIIGVMVARYDHTYQQGLERFWSRKDRFDFYWPVFANIGEQAIKNKEIYLSGTGGIGLDEQVFGYQEAWADYRYAKNQCTAMMRSAAATSLDSWHLADDYSNLPHLSSSWILEDKTNVDRVLAINSSVVHQMFADIYIQATATRPMPIYSIPGLMDHH